MKYRVVLILAIGAFLVAARAGAHHSFAATYFEDKTQTIEGNIVQGVSRTLWEEVKFDNKNVTSIDWMTYPILDITETPEKIDFVLINHPELPPTGAGEPSIRPVAAAIANAIFDATGVRIRRVPFSPDKVKQALS